MKESLVRKQIPVLLLACLALPLAFSGCLKDEPAPIAPGAGNPETSEGLDARHGGVRITLPEIDPASLNKRALDTVGPVDTANTAWFELSISGNGMQEMFFRFPIRGKQGGETFTIKGIPAGLKRKFQGLLRNSEWEETHQGTTLADIEAGALSDIRLYLKKSTGGADMCVVIEGQKLPPCAIDTVKPPIDTVKPPIDTVKPPKLSQIPDPRDTAATTICFTLSFFDEMGCAIEGYAKMLFQKGVIRHGNLTLGGIPAQSYDNVIGKYDTLGMSFQGTTPIFMSVPHDTLLFNGRIEAGKRRSAKGETQSLPSGKKGTLYLGAVQCGSWTTKVDTLCLAQ
jgi:hypothetical protein